MLRYGTVRTRRKNGMSFVAIGPDGRAERAPVLLVHPINLRKECWLDIARVLAGDRCCVAVDLPGHGESDDTEDLDLGTWVADCHDLVAALGLERCHLVGGSLGGTIALCLAGELPDALSVTAMGSSSASANSSANSVANSGSTGSPDPPDDPVAMLDSVTVEELFAVLAAEAVAPGSPDALVATVRHLTNSHGEAIVRRVLHAAQTADATGWLPRVRCPVLVLTGEFDTTCTPDAGRSMASGVGGRHEVLPNVGHLPMLEAPAAVLETLLPHLESSERKAVAR
jgi:3-oxoadipate enol-lactonase